MRPLIFLQRQHSLCQNFPGSKTNRRASSRSGLRRPVPMRALCLAVVMGLGLLCATATASTPASQISAAQTFPVTVVGQSSTLSVTVTLAAGGTAATPIAVTQGVANGEFTVTGNTCSGSTSPCTVSVLFSPKYPGLRSGAVVIENSAGSSVLGSALLNGMATGPLSVLIPGEINTVAGVGADQIFLSDGVLATIAPIYLPRGVAVDAAGNLFLADSLNNRVRRVDAVTGIISTVAGNGSPGFAGDGGLATDAQIFNPGGLVLDGAGNIYFVDSNNFVIRRVDAVSHIITTVAGTPDVTGFAGDNGLATSAEFSFTDGTGGLAFDTAGNLYIADTGNNAIREVTAGTGIITTVAGTGAAGFNGDNILATTARLNGPANLSIGPDGSLYIADLSNQRIRKVTAATGMITTIAGNGNLGFAGDGGPATAVEMNSPAAVLLDPAGNIYIADSGNNRLLKIPVTTGNIQIIAGGPVGDSGDQGPANMATMSGPSSLYLDQSGNLVFSDRFNNRVREIYSSLAVLPLYPEMREGKVSAPQIQGLENDGNADLTIDAPVLNMAELDPATTTCNTGSTLTFNTAGNDCNYGVDFAPTVTGDPASGTVQAVSNAGNSPGTINLSGQVLTVQPTTVTVVSSMNPSLVGNPVTFTATIAAGGDVTTGTVAFLNGSTPIAGCSSVPETSNETASCTTSALPLGMDSITASYSGDANDAAAVSPALVQNVQQPTTVMLTAAPNPVFVTQNVMLTATATAATGTPAGSITFFDGTTAIGSANLSPGGVASFTTATLAVGNQALTAQYVANGNDAGATSNTFNETVQPATTTTTLMSSNTTAPVGSLVTFTSTVSSTIGPMPTGTVTFMAGTTSLGSVTLGSNGAAVLPLSTLAPGTYSIVAVYNNGSDVDDATSSSAPLTEIIQKISTATTLSPSLNPISAGAVLTLSSTVSATGSATGAGALTGTVTFSEGATVYGVATVNGSGNASLPISTLPAGSHSIIATYSGNTNYATSTSTVLLEVVQSTSTTTTLTQAAPTTLAGQPASFTATVSSTTGGIPTGNVTFNDGGSGIGQATLNAQGVAIFSTTTLAVGTHSITAVYTGNVSYSTSTSAAVQHTVALATPTLTLAGPGTPVNAGTTFTMTATLSSNGVAPTGTLALHNGGTTLAIATVTANGTFTFPNLSLGVGTYQLTAVYSGNVDNATETSAPVTVVVQLTPTTTSLSSSANPATLGNSVTFTATASGGTPLPAGSIKFMDGATVLGSSPVGTGGVATFTTSTLTFGTHAITAVYQGDVDHAVSTSATLNERIVQAAAASLTSSVNPSIFGANVVFTVQVAGVDSLVPTGTVVVRDGATTLGMLTLNGSGSASLQTAALVVGSHTITASYSGDTNYSTASTSLIQTVQSATTQIMLTASANPATYATPVSLVATVKGNGGIATGPVAFTDGGASIGSAVLNANGVATLTLSTLPPGLDTVVANYAGDSNIGASSSTPLIVSVKEVTSVALASSANPAMTLSSVVLTATVSNEGVGQATGMVTFTDGSTQLGTAVLNANGVASLTVPSLAAGNHSLLASYAGDTDNFASTSATLAEGVQLRPTTTALTSSATDPNNPQQIALIASVGWTGPVAPTGTVTFTSGTTVLGSGPVDTIGIATLNVILSSPTENIVATYSGDAAYASSNSLATSISGGIATQFTIQLTPSTVSLPTTDHAAIGVTLTSLQGFSDTLQLGCLGLPDAATCTFSTPQMKLAANGTATVQLIIDTGNPLGAGATVSASLEKRASSGALLCLLPCLLGIGFGVRRRKFKLGSSLLLLCMIAMTLFASGCSGLHVNGTPPGTYSFKVTASGVGSGATESQAVTLTVTQ
jgi:large repetitive protein